MLTEAWDRSASDWEFADDGRLVFLEAEDRARSSVFAVPSGGGTPTALHEGGAVSGLAVAKSRLWFTLQTLTEPPRRGPRTSTARPRRP